jgi:hypothetical protein
MSQKPKKLELSADVILKLKEIRNILGGSPGLFNASGISRTSGCGAYCMVTCSYYCKPSCTAQCMDVCSNACELYCSPGYTTIGGGPITCVSMEPYWY